MKKRFSRSKYLKFALVLLVTCGVVASGVVFQTRILRVQAAVDILVVSDTAIPFGTVFPGEVLQKTYSVALDTSFDTDTYTTELLTVPGLLDLCPFLEITSIDAPAECDVFAGATLTRPGHVNDDWQLKLKVRGIEGHISQGHDGGIIVRGGDYGCDIKIVTDTVPQDPKLKLKKSGEVDLLTGKITYTIDWEVSGTGTLHDLTITDVIFAGLVFVSADHGGVYVSNTVTWHLGDKTAVDSGSVHFTVATFFAHSYADVLDYHPGSPASGAIRPLDATPHAPVLPDLEGGVLPKLDVKDLRFVDGQFVNTPFFGNFFGGGNQNVTVDDAAQTFVAMGDGGRIKISTATTSDGFVMRNGPGDDFILYETPGGRDPACVSVETIAGASYPLANNPACNGRKALKFQDTGPADSAGIPINLDSLGVPALAAIKSITVYDIEDGKILGTTGSPGYDLDAIVGRAGGPCRLSNTAEATGISNEKTLTASSTVELEINPFACRPQVELEKRGAYDSASGRITFTIDYHLVGEGAMHNVVISDPLPSGTTFVSASASGVLNGFGVVVWNLGDLFAPTSGSVQLVVDVFSDVAYDAVLGYTPGVSAAGTIRTLDATTNSPVLPQLEGAAFPILHLLDLHSHDGAFINTNFFGNFGSGNQTKVVDDEGRTFVALGDGGKITVGASTSSEPWLRNASGIDFTIYEASLPAGSRDPACVSVTAQNGTVYPAANNPACEGRKAFKFQDTGPTPFAGVPLNLDSLGVPANTPIKSLTIYDILDGKILGTTGSPGYDLDLLTVHKPTLCEYFNSAKLTSDNLAGEIGVSVVIISQFPECKNKENDDEDDDD